MQLLATLSSLALPGLSALSIGACAGSAALLVLTFAELDTRLLALCRCLLPALALALAVVAFRADAAAAAKAASSLAVLVGLEALAVAFAMPASLRRLAAMGERHGEPAWWPRFEREFRRYATITGVGSQRGSR